MQTTEQADISCINSGRIELSDRLQGEHLLFVSESVLETGNWQVNQIGSACVFFFSQTKLWPLNSAGELWLPSSSLWSEQKETEQFF